jgi:hypothetical protein
MTGLRHDTDRAPIAAVLFDATAVAIEIGLRVGRPRGGLIQVSQKNLLALHAGMRADAAR